MAQIISGTELAKKVHEELKAKIVSLQKTSSFHPGLAVVLVGSDAASQVYVRNKRKACEKVGIKSFSYDLPENCSEQELLQLIAELNANKEVHGILVQLPLPKHMNEQNVIMAIDPKKDVDCFHPVNVGKLMLGAKGFLPCTPSGMMEMLSSINYDLTGKHAVVIGRSNIVGKPIALLLLAQNATVSICHSKTKNLPDFVRNADLIVAAVGRPQMVKADWVTPGAVVLDVGINRTAENTLVGDVDFETVKTKASAITPVPGGVGPMTIAMLLKNVVFAAEEQ
ncbi:MAG: bifunctional methylenetetrahydrofolate dehydrogenase/methenyltetrahydrofolate cyclohydrolase FolD [Deltaproteobacteria bacterium CG_4_10_14_0_2_um_filter_43_8]|nr:MAG: bifunctional methylenetetrahydrofolate dehydrogenase/methenyltetrahydrofolate cyclohydrolase FolD [Deltaproteobacteria bacterium CG11_big_fil_rev_8_21_14_0_20_42_23]PJA20910.1 MAG: bifunctional methylenetetrahydrofolate dehydrogenase/methenyltetrahydrofolate cyclohydrolase FolD [Deltaproteobacteria bacterium CG_4_10_14_0_2_um_filter_43_8]PJC64590.1 MAG: bifunctional methylenetetrahydrofolate dehydrogenase/methenyltetrahydrofolate cyclohydrolase FolD [Deltaproteobacteria bacterium CG_4_9_1